MFRIGAPVSTQVGRWVCAPPCLVSRLSPSFVSHFSLFSPTLSPFYFYFYLPVSHSFAALPGSRSGAGTGPGWAVSHLFLFHSVRQIDIVSSSSTTSTSTLNLAFLAPLVLSRQPKPTFSSILSCLFFFFLYFFLLSYFFSFFSYHPDGIESIEREIRLLLPTADPISHF